MAMDRQPGEPVHGEVIDGPPAFHTYSWEWTDIGGPRGRARVPWFGIFLVVFGGLLLLQQAVPSLRAAGSILFLAVGVAFLVSWIANRGTGSLYLGSIISALAAPGLLEAGGIVQGPGLGTLCLGVAFLFIALVRAGSRAGWGWQAVLGVLLVAIGASSLAVPGVSDLLWPVLLVVLGVIVLARSSGRRRSR
jgi:hypothetical protein